MATNKVLKDMRDECECEKIKYCPLEAMLLSQRDYILEQHKLVEYAKYVWSERDKREWTWAETYDAWVVLGYAGKYREVYSDDKTYRQMRKELFGK